MNHKMDGLIVGKWLMKAENVSRIPPEWSDYILADTVACRIISRSHAGAWERENKISTVSCRANTGIQCNTFMVIE